MTLKIILVVSNSLPLLITHFFLVAFFNPPPHSWINKWTKGCIISFYKKGDLRITKNDWGITFIAAKVYKTLLLNCIEAEIENILWKNQNGSRGNRSMILQILTICQIIDGIFAKKPPGNSIVCRFLQGIWFHRWIKYFQFMVSVKKLLQP